MSFMRLGTRLAIMDSDGRILLSKRGDFGVWALPGGRLDSGESLIAAAIREAQEETGLQVEIDRAIGLYFQQGRSRMNILYRAHPIGGELYKATEETLDNRFFDRQQLPADRFGQFYIDHAYDDATHCYTIETDWWQLIKIDLKLRWRWLQNLLAGRREPKFVPFTVRAIGILWHDGQAFGRNGQPLTVESDGQRSLTEALSQVVRNPIEWHWVGVWQDTATDTLEFVFHADADDKLASQFAPITLNGHQQQYDQQSDHIWHIS